MVGRPSWATTATVGELHHRVDQLLRVDHDVDRVEGYAEQQVGLDHLEPLVDERGGVGRDDLAHREVRVGQRLLGRHVGELLAGPAPERAAAGGEHEAAYLLRRCRRAGTGRSRCARCRPARSGPAARGRAPAARPMIRVSLLASASVVPASSAARVGRSPTAPVIPLSTTSAASPAASTLASSPSAVVRRGELRHLLLEELRGRTRPRSGRRPGTGRGWPAPGRGPGCRSTRSSRAPPRHGESRPHPRSAPPARAGAPRSDRIRPSARRASGRPRSPGRPRPAGRRCRRSSHRAAVASRPLETFAALSASVSTHGDARG